MFLLTEPSEGRIREFLLEQSKMQFSYPEVGASRDAVPPSGYPINHKRTELGTGPETFRSAVEALHNWSMYEMDWTRLCWPDTPIKEGSVVGVLARHYGFWSLNACRIIYTLDDHNGVMRKGFAFGTLPGHSEQGEERFTVEWDHNSDRVIFELFAFAKPKHLIARIGYPISRRLQKLFAVESGQAMIEAVRRRIL